MVATSRERTAAEVVNRWDEVDLADLFYYEGGETRARKIATANGVRYAYTGNVHDAAGGSTYCHGCGQRLIERDWYELGEWNLDDRGRCNRCSEELPGVFDVLPGRWGARQQPVSMRSYAAR